MKKNWKNEISALVAKKLFYSYSVISILREGCSHKLTHFRTVSTGAARAAIFCLPPVWVMIIMRLILNSSFVMEKKKTFHCKSHF